MVQLHAKHTERLLVASTTSSGPHDRIRLTEAIQTGDHLQGSTVQPILGAPHDPDPTNLYYVIHCCLG